MRYLDLRERMQQMADAATSEARRRFADDSLRRLTETAGPAIGKDLTEEERLLLQQVFDAIDAGDFAAAKVAEDQLETLTSADEIRAIEIDGVVTDMMAAIGYRIDFERRQDSASIFRIASTMVDSIDNQVCGVVEEYGLENMLAAPEMREEYERQQRFLVSDLRVVSS